MQQKIKLEVLTEYHTCPKQYTIPNDPPRREPKVCASKK